MVEYAVRVAALVLFVAAVAQWRRARHRPITDPTWWLAGTLTAVATSGALFTELANRGLSRALDVVNIAEPLARTALLVGAWGAPVLLFSLTTPDVAVERARRRAWPVIGSIAALWMLFAISPLSSPLHSLDRSRPPDTWLTTFLLVAMIGLVDALLQVHHGARSYSHDASGSLARGLAWVSLGCALGLAHVAVKFATLLAGLAWPAPAALVEATLGRGLAVAGGVLVALGCLLPGLAKRTAPTRRELHAAVALFRLHPLWSLGIQTHPDVVLLPSAGRLRELWPLHDAEARLYRRIVELRDVQLAMGNAAPNAAGVEGAGHHFTAAVASAESATRRSEGLSETEIVGRDLDRHQEIQWWVQVSRALARQRTLPTPAETATRVTS